jgi:hypothetical protein
MISEMIRLQSAHFVTHVENTDDGSREEPDGWRSSRVLFFTHDQEDRVSELFIIHINDLPLYQYQASS